MSFFLRSGTIVFLIMMGTMAGFFFAFSFVVMPGFDLIEPATAITAMQGINNAVRNAVFFVPFFLTPVLAAILVASAYLTGQRKTAALICVSGLAYLLGAFFLTMLYHVPMNEALAVLDVAQLADTAGEVWQMYSLDWTPWNTFRTIVCLVAMVPAAMALTVQETSS